MNWFQEWALTLAIFLPAVGLAIILLLPKAEETAAKVVALVTTLATLGVGVGIAVDFDYDHSGKLQFVGERAVDRRDPRPATTWASTASRCRCCILSMFVTVLCVIYSWNHFPEPHNPKAFLALILLLEVGMNGTFLAEDLILFFIFFEVVLLPMFFMIGVWGGPNREYASIKFFLFTLFGSALMLLGFLALFFLEGTFQIPALTLKGGGDIVRITQNLIFAGLFLGFAIKVPDVPVPHVAARRAHRGADRRLGAAGRDPPEARDLRLHPHRAADPAEGRATTGRRGSGC